ncbi:hypothetical protein OG814_33125 [Streptomyces zaomyceticus]|uniref:Uncharacterized protein n=1 Tax=Streptomyces zaomyceticus TaxID=68286 RepID=A0ABZ1LHF8_9ACTN
MSTPVILDLGPKHYVHTVEMEADTVCVLTPRVTSDTSIQAIVRTFLRKKGMDCSQCCGCPAGTAE